MHRTMSLPNMYCLYSLCNFHIYRTKGMTDLVVSCEYTKWLIVANLFYKTDIGESSKNLKKKLRNKYCQVKNQMGFIS